MDKVVSYTVVAVFALVVTLFVSLILYGNVLLLFGVGTTTSVTGFSLLAVGVAAAADILFLVFALVSSIIFFPKAWTIVERDIRNRRSKKKN